MPPDQVPAYLARARALVLPSICYEGAPRTVVEAYAAGVPVVANRYGALPGVVSDGVTGLLVEPGDAGGVAHGASASVMDDDTSAEAGGGGVCRLAHRLQSRAGNRRPGGGLRSSHGESPLAAIVAER